MAERVVEFLRKKDFVLKAELGQGACGQTVLLYDTAIDEYFVCKKYMPLEEAYRESLYDNFKREIKLLHVLNHQHVVRVFNYYLYPTKFAGYILMEYVQGADIQKYLGDHPENTTQIFEQVIDGFMHLEQNKVLHRDIRPQNLMVTDGGRAKIIDFGFGKQIFDVQDYGKSITLNWWCEPPAEFKESLYNHQTEVYFVGKLFEKIILDEGVQQFKHLALLERMCASSPQKRTSSFTDVRKELFSDKFSEIDFEEWEYDVYRDFSKSVYSALSKIARHAKYYEDVADIQIKLDASYKKMMLEEYAPRANLILSCFIDGPYYYHSHYRFPIASIRSFLGLLASSSREKKNIILANLQTKLDGAERYDLVSQMDDDIPF
jgi:eukaryotic-like serine/threonine-protein kinase